MSDHIHGMCRLCDADHSVDEEIAYVTGAEPSSPAETPACDPVRALSMSGAAEGAVYAGPLGAGIGALGGAVVGMFEQRALETLALIAEHRLTIAPRVGHGWIVAAAETAAAEEMEYADWSGASTIGDAVRACVERIKGAL